MDGEPTLFWPPGLPRAPLQSSYREQPPNLVLRTAMEYGPPKMRRRCSSNMTRFSVSYDLRPAQKTLLEAFLELSAGVSFWFPKPAAPDVEILVRYLPESEEGACSFAPNGPCRWSVTLNLEAWPYAVRTFT